MNKGFSMLNRLVVVVLFLLTLPVFANAQTYWAITASATPASLTSVAAPTPTGSGFTTTNRVTNVTSSNVTSVVFNVAATPTGYKLTSVTVDGSRVKKSTPDSNGNYQYETDGPFTVNKGTMLNHSIVANYTVDSRNTFQIKSIPSAGGWISSSVTVGLNATPSFSIIANPGHTLEGVKIDGGALIIGTGGTYTFDPVKADHTIQGVFIANKSLNAILSIPSAFSAAPGSVLNVIGSTQPGYTTGVTYDWTGTTCTNSAVGTDGATSTRAITVPATASCIVLLKATADGMNNTTTATITALEPVNVCLYCHDGTGGPDQRVFSTSAHATAGKTCSSCHNPNNDLSHAYKAVAAITCTPCHTGNVPPTGHPIETNNAACNTCHNPHSLKASCTTCHGYPPTELTARSSHTGSHTSAKNCASCHGADAGSKPNHDNGTVNIAVSGAPHYNNITSALYPASYVPSKATCGDCHNDNSNNQTIRQQWATTGHANTTALPWTEDDFKTRSECVRCHTTTGFIAYSTAKVTAAWGVATDKTKEVLTCVGCHSDVANGIVRTVTPNKPFADESSYTNRNVGPSNICMDCHSGRNNGASIQVKVGTADFTNLTYIAPHYLTAGGTLHGKSGYEFRTYAGYSSNSHRQIGMSNTKTTGTNGPCVACHMSFQNKKHTFKPVSSANGEIAAITTTVCTNCHGSGLTAAALDAKRLSFNNALDVLKAQLAAKNHTYSPEYPYFASGNWGTGQNGANVMGAAFNYALLLKEPGAYAHNSTYTKQLILDSIEVAYNGGTILGNISSALSSLVSSEAITQQQADSLIAYSANTSCTACPGNPPATIAHSGAAHPADTNCSTCHNTDPSVHSNGTVDVSKNCNACHGNPPAYENGSPKANSHSSHNYGCSSCHAGTTSDGTTIANTTFHMNGVYNLQAGSGASFTYTYASTGGTCSNISCHNGGTAVWGTTLTCGSCHVQPPGGD